MRKKRDLIFNNKFNMNEVESRNVFIDINEYENKYNYYEIKAIQSFNENDLLYQMVNDIIVSMNLKKITKGKYKKIYYDIINNLKKDVYNQVLFNELQVFMVIASMLGVDYLKFLISLKEEDIIKILNCLEIDWCKVCKYLF